MNISIENLDLLNDMIIEKIVNNKSSFGDELYAKAVNIYQLRNLDSPEKQKLIERFPRILEKARKHAFRTKSTKKSISELLKKEGVSSSQIPVLTDQLYKTPLERELHDAGSWSDWVLLFMIILYFVKLAYKS